MRKPFVAGNWKMNTTAAVAEQLARSVVERVGQEAAVDVAVCPPFPYLAKVGQALADSRIMLGAQNCHHEAKGAFTGEISPAMLLDCGCKWVIVGHSERRHLLGEVDDFLRRKVYSALNAGLSVILCVGETLDQRQANETEGIIETQLRGGLEQLPPEKLPQIVIAYEPVWAIGTGQNATPDQAERVHHFIRGWLDGEFGSAVAQQTRILYGGSVTAANAGELFACSNVDGGLIGGASLKDQDFAAIVKAAIPTNK